MNQFISILNIFRGSKLIINNKWIPNLYETFRKGVQWRNKMYTAYPLRHFYAANFLISTDCLKSNNMKIHLVNNILFQWFLFLMQLPHFFFKCGIYFLYRTIDYQIFKILVMRLPGISKWLYVIVVIDFFRRIFKTQDSIFNVNVY